MPPTRDAEETAVIATFPTRRDAEAAKDFLRQEAAVDSFVRSDDAGGLHPELQRPHGVQLVGMSRRVSDGRAALDDAGLLSQERGEQADTESLSDGEAASRTFSMRGVAGTLGSVAVLVILFWFLSRLL